MAKRILSTLSDFAQSLGHGQGKSYVYEEEFEL